ncbi:MAG: hypothetical protein WC759_05540 [Candidatus Micrarchaeia archaeon]|jgi:hypothetical protein
MKSCLFCKQLNWERMDYHYYSTLTGGDMEGGFHCPVQWLNKNPKELSEFVEVAEKCESYEPAA